KNSRYKIINCQRLKNENTSTSSLVNEELHFTIYDIENEKEINNSSETNSDSYLYDLYYAHWAEFQKDVEDNELISVYPLSDQLIYGSYRDNGINERDTDESEDSNDENNWRNDYPDESDMESVTEDDMLNAVNKISLDHENSLSSDDDDDDIYNDDNVENTQIDTDDANRYGKMYA
ncbi:probable RNA polymerase II nuclear localization protein SLC7A6OS, partial [Agrilus planipennis]